LEAICLQAMALKPADRYPTALHLAADIEHWLADEPVTAYRDPWLVRLRRWERRHQWMAPRIMYIFTGVATFCALALLVAMVIDLERQGHELRKVKSRVFQSELRAQATQNLADRMR